MMITLKIVRPDWRFKLHAGLHPTGTWYAFLCDDEGERMTMIMASRYTSADAVITNALVVYRELAARLLPSRSNATRDNSKITEPTFVSTNAITGA